MEIDRIIQHLCTRTCQNAKERQKINAFFELDHEMLNIVQRTNDPMAGLLRLAWHREQAQLALNGNCINATHKYFECIAAYPEEFQSFLETYFTAWEYAIEKNTTLSAHDIINKFISKRSVIWKSVSPQIEQLITTYHTLTFLIMLPNFYSAGWEVVTSDKIEDFNATLFDAAQTLHNNTSPDKKFAALYAANSYILNKWQKNWQDYKKPPPRLNLGILYLKLLFA